MSKNPGKKKKQKRVKTIEQKDRIKEGKTERKEKERNKQISINFTNCLKKMRSTMHVR